ncbi:MAG: PQQ-like beta-propeller repeat protein [Planctomycetales bacterium]|nr:PQQ-like beta-propeller repeat protein [Planctomycetales bacterium]
MANSSLPRLAILFVALTTIVHAEAQELVVDGMSAAPAMIVEERPTTRLPLADLTNLARIDELLGSDKLDEAIDLLVVAFEQPRPKPVLHLESAISADGRIGQTYWPASLIAQARFARLCETRPLWLVAYRERVDRRAQLALQQAREQGDLDHESNLLASFLLTSQAAVAIEDLADRFLAANRPQAALHWYRLLPLAASLEAEASNDTANEPAGEESAPANDLVLSAPSFSESRTLGGSRHAAASWHLPLSMTNLTPERQFAIRYKMAVAWWLARQRSRAVVAWIETSNDLREAGRLRSAPLRLTITIQGTDIDPRSWSARILGIDPALEEAAWLGHARSLESDTSLGSEESLPLLPDETWVPAWRLSVEPVRWLAPDRRVGLDGGGAGGGPWYPRIRPGFDRDLLIVWNGEVLRVVNRWTGEPWISLTPSIDDAPLRRGLIWERADYELPLADQKPVEGAPRYQVSVGRDCWSVRGGDPRVVDQETTTRVRSWRAAFDVQRDAALQPGSPWRLDEGLEWEGSAVERDGMWWAVQRESARRDERSRAWLVAWRQPSWLPPAAEDESPSIPPLIHRIALGEASNQTRGSAHECSHVGPTLDEESVYVAGPTGSVVAVDRRTGRERWWFTYPQRLADEHSRWESSQYRWRDGGEIWSDGDLVVALPADSDRVFALNADDGRLRWSVSCPQAGRVVGRAGRWLILSGAAIHWLDLETGELARRFPAINSAGESSPSWESPVFGDPALVAGKLLVSTHSHLEILESELQAVPRRDGSFAWEVVPSRSIAWRQWEIEGGGHLFWHAGVCWVANDREIVRLAPDNGLSGNQ